MLLNRRCNQSLCRKQGVLLTSRTNGRPFRRVNHFAEVCRLLGKVIRHTNMIAKASPHLFGPYAHRYFLDTMRQAQSEAETDAALAKVYGPPKPGDPPLPPGVWTRRYFIDPQWKGFRKWFRENYAAPPTDHGVGCP